MRNQTAFLFRDGIVSATDALLALGNAAAAATALGVFAADADDPESLREDERRLRITAALGADGFDAAYDRGFFFSPLQRLAFLDELARD
ncbi:hypothetical protein WPS_12530 [Vulcanimicrobium alpinum]|uniref:Uncharacterized protein n=1 Tax=Vulcanimicrobium alpinum TaxID=3016050 RepID=A0AAN1XXB0_UNVUL|nr:hypothetical protein WPS_12530 [Vulcanimicrobium alpinum]